MHAKLKQYQDIVVSYLVRFNDLRFTGQVIFAVIVILISWSGARTIQTNYNLQKQVAVLKQQNELQKIENENLALQNKYYASNQYLDLSARQNLGLASPGEKELLVPASVALSYTVNVPSDNQAVPKAAAKQPTSQRNFEAWVNFFLHRQGSSN